MLLRKKIPFVFIIETIRYEIFYVAIIGFTVFLFTLRFRAILPEMPISIPTFLGTAISVILSFKLSQSYDRWWEARKIWGAIVNDSRNLILQLQSFVLKPDIEVINKLALRQIAWCYCLGQTLRQQDPMLNMNKYLNDNDIEEISTHSNKPLALLQLHTHDIAWLKNEGYIDIFGQVQINNTMVNLTNSMGMAERIKNTVFPSTYRYFLRLIIYLFVITLSISLRNIQSYFEIPLLIVLSSAFFLLEKTATFLQDPFDNYATDTPITSIANTIEINIRQLINDPNTPKVLVKNQFYVM